MLAPYLSAIRKHGQVVESIIRVVSGSEDSSDLAIILKFFTFSPQTLLSLSSRRRSADRAPLDAPGGNVDVTHLAPIDRDTAVQSRDAAGKQTAFEQLLERLRGYISSNPPPESEVGEEGDQEEEPERDGVTDNEKSSRRKRGDKKKKRKPRRIPHEDFYRLVDAFEERIEERSEKDEGRRDDLITLLDIGLYFAARAEDAASLKTEFLDHWTELAIGLTGPSDPPDELEHSLLLVLLAGVMSGRYQPSSIHAVLQRRLNRLVDPVWAEKARPDYGSARAAALAPDAPPETWADTFSKVLSSRTPWMDAVEAWSAICAGKEIPSGNALLREPEAETLRAVTARKMPITTIQVVDGKQEKPFCPKCYMTLPAIQTARLRAQHIATAAACCTRVLLNLQP
jgi:hypothetical protein